MLWYENPCRFCTPADGRNETCHSTCKKHKEWLLENEKKRAFEKAEQDRRHAIITPAFESMNLNVLRRKREHRK